VTLAFIITGRRACTARWDADISVAGKPFMSTIVGLRAAGVEPTLSFGGQAGRELGLTCRTPSSLAKVYGAVASAYGITSLDFDLEGPGLARSALARRSQAMRLLQRRNPALKISLTLPVTPLGLLPNAMRAVRAAINAGVRIDSVNIMTMDFGDEDAPDGNRMADYSISAAQATHKQLAKLGHGLDSWGALAITPMIGINDLPNEIFTLADASTLATFAATNGVGQLHYWVFNRDRPCAVPSIETQNECSGVLQAPGAFAVAFLG
jgi:chitinase